MREIKFRVYIKKTKEMLPVVSIVQMNDEEGLRVFPKGYDRNFLESEGDIVLMQYIGIKDKNGKEVYEGDLVIYGNKQGVIEYRPGCFYIKYLYEGSWGLGYGENLEILGNIYENPELVTNV